LKGIPVVGTFLNVLTNVPNYATPLEDCAFILLSTNSKKIKELNKCES
jgi:hypothetical protein